MGIHSYLRHKMSTFLLLLAVFVAQGATNCFPYDWKHQACPPVRGVRVIDAPHYDKTTKEDTYDCFGYCINLNGETGVGCNAWSFDSSSLTNNCYTYNITDCYHAARYQGWFSGQTCGFNPTTPNPASELRTSTTGPTADWLP